MKIIQITTFSYKAAGNIMMNLHKTMLMRGIDSYVAWGRGRQAENDHEYYMGDNVGVKIHGVYTRLSDKTGFASIKSTKKLLQWIDKIEPDIIHLHCIHGYYINIELLFEYIKKKNIKVIWTQHDCWAFTGHCAYFDACGCDKWKTGCHNCEQLATYPASILLDNSSWNWKKKKNLFSGINAIIVTPCKWLAQLTSESFLGKYPTRVIYNGIDTNVYKPKDSNYKERVGNKKIILGVASEWTERKGLKDFIKLDSMIDKDSYVIVLVGVTKKQIKSLPEDIIAIERTNNVNEMVEIYSAADVFINPTYEDNFPTTNLESLACGTPVITYKTGGAPEAIYPGAGYVVNKGNIDDCSRLIESAIKLKRTNDNLFSDDSFDVQTMISKYLEIYYE